MKKIKMMPDVVIPEGGRINQDGGRDDLDFTMVKFLNACMNSHEKFGKGLTGVSQGLKIKEAFDKAKSAFQLEDAEYNELKKALDNVTLNPVLAMGCKIYYEAIEDAVDAEVKKK